MADRTAKSEINDILTSGNYYVTPEIAAELRSLHNGLDHLRLDSTIQSSSPEWRTKLMTRTNSTAGSTGTIGRVNSLINQYKSHLHKENVSKLQENQIREMHHWAMINLKGLKGEIQPYASEAFDRLRQFSDHIGVTDRYTGYRNNLTRGSREPFKLDTYWMRKQGNNPATVQSRLYSAPVQPNTFNQYTMSSNEPLRPSVGIPARFASAQPNGLHRSASAVEPRRHCHYSNANPQSVQEACGINMTFPGKSESRTRYTRPPPDQKTSPFIINPATDYYIYGRPLAKLQSEASFTEYQTRYEWPDSGKIMKLPWLRK